MIKSFNLLILIISLISFSVSTITTPFTHTLQIYHRILPHKSTISTKTTATQDLTEFEPKWNKKALIRLDLNIDSLWLDLNSPSMPVDKLEGGEGYYQVAVRSINNEEEELEESIDEVNEDKLSIIAIDTCNLLQTSKLPLIESLTLDFNPIKTEKNFLHFDFQTNSKLFCKGKLEHASDELILIKGKSGIRGGNINGKEILSDNLKLYLSRGYVPEPPRFKEITPVKVGKDGKVLPPVKEKGFIEKYWMYAIPLMVLFILTGGEEEPAAAGSKKE